MEQLIFVGIILLFSMLEAVARKKRGADPGDVPLPEPSKGTSVARPPRPPERILRAYDHDPSFDDAVEAGSQGGRASSEGLIPVDVWEEIQAMARGDKTPVRTAPRPTPAPEQARTPATARERTPARVPRAAPPPMSTVARKTRAPEASRAEAVAAPEHAVHLTHPKFGTPVHDRLTGFGEDGGRRAASADLTALRTVLRGGSAGLRQAILLQEILGPPVSLKDDPSAG